jgi:hypothetical protein
VHRGAERAREEGVFSILLVSLRWVQKPFSNFDVSTRSADADMIANVKNDVSIVEADAAKLTWRRPPHSEYLASFGKNAAQLSLVV